MAKRDLLEVGFFSEQPAPADLISELKHAGVALRERLTDSAEIVPFGVLSTPSLDADAIECIRRLSQRGRNRLLVLLEQRLVDYSDAVWQALSAGASDVLLWDQLTAPAEALIERFRRWSDIDSLIALPIVQNHLVGESDVWRSTLRRLVEAARFSTWPVLLTGDTGTGKELAARLMHTLDSPRSKAEIVVLDCTTIVPDLSGSELFGHERGAYTGAVAARDGAFAVADKGTLFLDEVGELQLNLQVQLLRVLQEHTYKRVGSNDWRTTDFRLISATNRDLLLDVTEGKFRADLYHRIAAVCIALPALRDRLEDVLPLARHFARSAMAPAEKPPEFDESVELFLMTRDYPGNVRELSNLVHRIVARHVGAGPITAGDIPPEERPERGMAVQTWCNGSLETLVRQAFAMGANLRDIRHAVEEAAIRIALEVEEGSTRRAAQRLALTDRALQKRRADQRRNRAA